MAINLSLKPLVYKELQPIAQAIGCQLLVIDSSSYKFDLDALKKMMNKLGVADSQYIELMDAFDVHSCIAMLKSKKFYGFPEIAHFFSKYGLKDYNVHMLSSNGKDGHPIWGDLDASIPNNKHFFFYWFSVDIRNANNDALM